MRKLLCVLTVVAFMASCSKENLNNGLIEGQWKWKVTSNCTCNPSSPGTFSYPGPGENYILKFNIDKTFSYTKDGTVLRSGTYRVKQESTHTGAKGWFLYYSGQSTPKLIVQSDTLLNLGTDALGGGSEQYTRF